MKEKYIRKGIIIGHVRVWVEHLTSMMLCSVCYDDYLAGRLQLTDYDKDKNIDKCKVIIDDEEIKKRLNKEELRCVECGARLKI